MEILLILLVVLAILGLWYISTLNGFRRMLIKIDEAESSIDVALTQRFDTLNKMFKLAKGYMKYEKGTLEGIVKLRQPGHSADIKDKEKFANEVSKGIQALNVVVENYPDLKASTNIGKVQDASLEIEENLQASRRLYNSNVSYYNQSIVVFPGNIVANMKQFKKRDFFEADPAKRQDVDFEF